MPKLTQTIPAKSGNNSRNQFTTKPHKSAQPSPAQPWDRAKHHFLQGGGAKKAFLDSVGWFWRALFLDDAQCVHWTEMTQERDQQMAIRNSWDVRRWRPLGRFLFFSLKVYE
jgi:hypothetical protein